MTQGFSHNKMILCLVAVHTSAFNILRQAFCIKSMLSFLFFIPIFLSINILGNFLNVQICDARTTSQPVFIINTIFNIKIHSYKPLQYTWECNNRYKL